MIPMNIALRPTEKIKKIIQSQDNYHFVINEIVEDSIIKGTKVWFKIPLKTDY